MFGWGKVQPLRTQVISFLYVSVYRKTEKMRQLTVLLNRCREQQGPAEAQLLAKIQEGDIF